MSAGQEADDRGTDDIDRGGRVRNGAFEDVREDRTLTRVASDRSDRTAGGNRQSRSWQPSDRRG